MGKWLFRKMLRDMRRSWVTYGICTMIVAVGFCGYCVLSACMDRLDASRAYFFRETGWCDGFALVEQAPQSAAERLAQLPGVRTVEGRLVKEVPVRGFPSDETHVKLISVSEQGMNRPLLEEGRMPRAKEAELVVGSGFFKTHGLSLGTEMTLLVQGQERSITVCGQGISPENIYMIRDLQEMLPAVDRYDAAFISYDTMAQWFQQTGTVNQFLFSMEPGVSFAEIEDQVREILEPYSCLQTYESEDDMSVSVLNLELEQVRKMKGVVPLLFLGVAAIIFYIVLHRLLEQQRVQTGTLMALGIRPGRIRLHYLAYGLLVGVTGGALGGLSGYALAGPMADYYRVFFQLPDVPVSASWSYLLQGVGMAGGFCSVVAWLCTREVETITPAQALRPPAPPSARRFFLERLPGFTKLFTVPGILALRSLARHRRRSLLSLFGIACAFMVTASLVSMNTLFDVFLFDELEKNQQQDLSVQFLSPVREADALDILRHPKVEQAEGVLTLSARLEHGGEELDCTISGIDSDARLTRLYDEEGYALSVQREGIVISELMAERLGVTVGDFISFTTFYPEKTTHQIPVTAVMAQYIGSTAYMSREALGNLTPYRGLVNSVLLKAPEEVRDELKERLRQSPLTGTIATRQEHIDQYRTMMGSMGAIMASMAALGVLIGLAVIYTSSLIYFEELKREISTMLMLGLKSRQCLDVITVGQWILALGGVLLGIPMSMWASSGISRGMAAELYVIPDFVDGPSLIWSIGLTFLAVWVSSQMILRRLRRMSPAELLRERE